MKSEPLTLKYRPRRFSELAGQSIVRVILEQIVRQDALRPALLFHGHRGSGKTSTARIFAASLNCEKEEISDRPCGQCDTCESITQGVSTDVTELDAASSGLAEDMRELRQVVRYVPHNRYRVIILDEAHEVTSKGFQTILKTLEEPPPNTVFILVTNEPSQVPDTIVSRCFSIEFHRLTGEQLFTRLRQVADAENLTEAGLASDDLLTALVARAHGAVRDALQLLDQASLARVRTPAQLVTLLGEVNLGVRLVTLLAGTQRSDGTREVDYPAVFAAVREALCVVPTADEVVTQVVTILKNLLSATATQQPEPELAGLVAEIPPTRIVLTFRVIWDYYNRVKPLIDSYASLDLFMVRVAEALSGASKPGDSARRESS
jgi:DNA polymerase III subunit gamma/tau